MNDQPFNRPEENFSDGRSELENVGALRWTKIFRVLRVKIPLWLILTVVVVVAGFSIYMNVTSDDPVSLRPAINDAKRVTIEINTCNKQLDQYDINQRQEEKDLEKKFRDIENVSDARVMINRDQRLCGTDDK